MVTSLPTRLFLLSAGVLAFFLTGCASKDIVPTSDAAAQSSSSSSVSSSSGSTSSSRFAFLRERMGLTTTATGASTASRGSLAEQFGPSAYIPPAVGSTSSVSSAGSSVTAPMVASIPVSGTITSTVWSSESDKLAISVVPDRFEVFPGDTVTYYIRVCNKSSETLTNVPVTFAFSGHEMTVIAISDGGRYAPGRLLYRPAPLRSNLPPVTGAQVIRPEIVNTDATGVRSDQDRIDWTIPSLLSGETKVVSVTLRMSESLRRGDVVRGDALSQQVRALSQVRILDRMPFTGADSADASTESPLIDEVWRHE